MGGWGVQGRMKRLEQVRLEVDSRRHTVNALNHAISTKQGRQPKPGTNPSQSNQRLETQIELTIRRMQHKENKLAGAALPLTLLALQPLFQIKFASHLTRNSLDAS